MKYQLAVFDLAGTTVNDNNDVARVLQLSLVEHGVIISLNEANMVMGIPKPVAIRRLLERSHKVSEISSTWIEEIHQQFVKAMIEFYERDTAVVEKPGVSSTFERLKSLGVKVAVDTGFDRNITEPLLRRLGWAAGGLLDFSVTSDEVDHGRPYPDMIFRAMAATGVSNSRAVVKVGDTPFDIQEGKAAGCGMVVAVTTGAFSAGVLERENPDHLIDQVPALLNLVE